MREKLRVELGIEPSLVPDQIPEMYFLDGRDDGRFRVLVERIGVGANCALDEERLLRNCIQPLSDYIPGKLCDIDTVNGNDAVLGDLEHPKKGRDEGALATATAATNSNLLARFYGHAEVTDDLVTPGGVRGRDVLELDCSVQWPIIRHRFVLSWEILRHRLGGKTHQACNGTYRRLELCPHFDDCGKRLVKTHHIE